MKRSGWRRLGHEVVVLAVMSACGQDGSDSQADDDDPSRLTAGTTNGAVDSGSNGASTDDAEGASQDGESGIDTVASSESDAGAESGDACAVGWSAIPDQFWLIGMDVSVDLGQYLEGGDAVALGLILDGSLPDGVVGKGALLSGAATELFSGEVTATVDAPGCAASPSTTFSITVVAATALSTAAAALKPGDTAPFTLNPLQRALDIQWQVAGVYYDATNRELQYMGKAASSQANGMDYYHYVYSEIADTWSESDSPVYTGLGHVWMHAWDPEHGDFYIKPYGGAQFMRRYDRAAGNWSVTAEFDTLGDGNATEPGPVFHPNLFGPGQPGMFYWDTFYLSAFNLTTQTWVSLYPGSTPSDSAYRARSTGHGVYLPGTDQVVMYAGGNDLAEQPGLVVEAGAGLSEDAVADGLISLTPVDPPVEIRGSGADNPQGHLLNDPNNLDRMLILEEEGSARVWSSTDQGGSWTLEDYIHPFDTLEGPDEFNCGEIEAYGVIVGMKSNFNGGDSMLWRPDN